MAGISNIAGMALSYRSIRCLISFATFWAMMMIATSSRWEKLAKVDSISFVVVSAMRCDQTQNIFFWEGGRNEVRSELLGDAFLAAGVLTRVDDEEVRVLPVVLVPDAREEEPRHRVLSGARESCCCGWRTSVCERVVVVLTAAEPSFVVPARVERRLTSSPMIAMRDPSWATCWACCAMTSSSSSSPGPYPAEC